MFWEVSPEGRAWSIIGMMTDLTGLDRVQIQLQFAADAPKGPVEAHVDNVNVAP